MALDTTLFAFNSDLHTQASTIGDDEWLP